MQCRWQAGARGPAADSTAAAPQEEAAAGTMKSKSKRTNQQPTGKRVEKRPPAWMYKIPAGVREFLGFAPLIAIAYVLSSYFNEWYGGFV